MFSGRFFVLALLFVMEASQVYAGGVFSKFVIEHCDGGSQQWPSRGDRFNVASADPRKNLCDRCQIEKKDLWPGYPAVKVPGVVFPEAHYEGRSHRFNVSENENLKRYHHDDRPGQAQAGPLWPGYSDPMKRVLFTNATGYLMRRDRFNVASEFCLDPGSSGRAGSRTPHPMKTVVKDAVLGTLPGVKTEIVRAGDFQKVRKVWLEREKVARESTGKTDPEAVRQILGRIDEGRSRYFFMDCRRQSDFKVASLIRRYPLCAQRGFSLSYDGDWYLQWRNCYGFLGDRKILKGISTINLITCADPGVALSPGDRVKTYRRSPDFKVASILILYDIGSVLPSWRPRYFSNLEAEQRRCNQEFWDSAEGKHIKANYQMYCDLLRSGREAREEALRHPEWWDKYHRISGEQNLMIKKAREKDEDRYKRPWIYRDIDKLWNFHYYRRFSGPSIASAFPDDPGRHMSIRKN